MQLTDYHHSRKNCEFHYRQIQFTCMRYAVVCSELRKYACDQCDKRFIESLHLTRHKFLNHSQQQQQSGADDQSQTGIAGLLFSTKYQGTCIYITNRPLTVITLPLTDSACSVGRRVGP